MKRLCPNCGYFGAMETHVVRGRIEIVCPRCGFRVLVFRLGGLRKIQKTEPKLRWVEKIRPEVIGCKS